MQELDALMRDKLETHCRQQLSAMLDGALAPDEARFLLRRLQHDHELAGCWERWQLCGDLLRGSTHALLPRDFSQRLLAAIGDEGHAGAAAAAVGTRNGTRWGWAGGAALAASVAMAALFIVQRNPAALEPTPAAPAVPQIAASASPPALPVNPAPTPPEPASSPTGPETAAPVATAALVASDVTRRGTRRARAAVRSPADRATTERPAVVEVAMAEPAGAPATQAPEAVAAAHDPFAATVLTPSRPWPRAVLPGIASGSLTVDYQSAGSVSSYDYFEPQLPVEEAPPQ